MAQGEKNEVAEKFGRTCRYKYACQKWRGKVEPMQGWTKAGSTSRGQTVIITAASWFPERPVGGWNSAYRLRGDVRCYNCNRWGHYMSHCPHKNSVTAAAISKALMVSSCSEVAWNPQSVMYL